ncbi:MAG: hypothetical protein NTX21_00120 [Alphaproteobacteria bacterium]|nr:hypothetical protein [Alphaproteobacteria bacterium]
MIFAIREQHIIGADPVQYLAILVGNLNDAAIKFVAMQQSFTNDLAACVDRFVARRPQIGVLLAFGIGAERAALAGMEEIAGMAG